MDGVVDTRTAGIIGKIGGLGVLNLEGIQTRYEEADAELERSRSCRCRRPPAGSRRSTGSRSSRSSSRQRIREIKAQGVVVAGSLTPQKVTDYIDVALEAGLDILVIQGTVVSAEHVSSVAEPLNLKRFIAELPVPVIVGGCASYHTALHLMRTGAVGVLVGVGPGAACTTRQVIGVGVPQATAIADAAGARMQHLLETGQYVNVIADGGMAYAGDLAKAIACGADACMIGSPFAKAAEAPGRGYHWGMATFHPQLPRGTRVKTQTIGTLEEILTGPAHENDGTLNLVGGLRSALATCGYDSIQSFQKCEVMVAPALKTEGKKLQQTQAVGMG